MNSFGLEFKPLFRWPVGAWVLEHRPQNSGVLLDQEKTKKAGWTFLVHSARRMKAFTLFVLLMAVEEDYTIRVT